MILFVIAALAQQRATSGSAAAISQDQFIAILPQLGTAHVPLLLPTGLHGLYAGYSKVLPGYYWVDEPHCQYRACYLGGVGGQRGSRPPKGAPFPLALSGTPVHLHGGITGHFLAQSHGADDLPVQVTCNYRGFLYQVFLKVGDKASVI